MKNKQFAFLAGLPRTGSTLLTSVLYQNPTIHTGGNSPVCPIMLGLFHSCWTNAKQQIFANNAQQKAIDLISSVPYSYYSDISRPIILDKCRSWIYKPNVELIVNYITDQPKFIVMLRPVEEILLSYGYLRMNNKYPTQHGKDWTGDVFSDLLSEENRQFILTPAEGIIYAKKNFPQNCIFITYDELVNNTRQVLKNIYNFFGWEWFDHNLENIVNENPENDGVYNLKGQHEVRPKISKQKINLKLPKYLKEIAQEINYKIGIYDGH